MCVCVCVLVYVCVCVLSILSLTILYILAFDKKRKRAGVSKTVGEFTLLNKQFSSDIPSLFKQVAYSCSPK